MAPFLADVRPYLEAAYFLSCVTLAVAAVCGLRQIRLLKTDITMRSSRAAREKAIEAACAYTTHYIPLTDKFYEEYTGANLKSYSGPIGDFSEKSVPPEHRENMKARMALKSWVDSMNRLETIAAFFCSGVADDEAGFVIVGRSFCANVASQYDVIAGCRFESAVPYWNNVVNLYGIWSPRLTKAELKVAKEDLETRMRSIADRRIPQIGPNQC